MLAANQHPALLLFFLLSKPAQEPQALPPQHSPSLSHPLGPPLPPCPPRGPSEALVGRNQVEFGSPCDAHIEMILTAHATFVQNRAKDCQAVADSRTVPTPASELVLALLDASLDAFSHAGHDLHIVPAEAQLLGHQAWDAGTEDGLSAQGGVLGSHSQRPGGKTWRLETISGDRHFAMYMCWACCCFCHEGHVETWCC